MKKLLKIILILQLTICTNVFASDYKDYMLKKYDKVPGVYVTKISPEHQVYDYMYIITRKSDNQFIYCIEPGLHIDDNYEYNGIINGYENSNLTRQQYERIKLLSYYGYGYIDPSKGINHSDKKWYAVTQGLIWEIESNNHEIYFTDYLQGPKVNKFVEEYEEIKNLANNYNILPSFANQSKNLVLGETVSLIDINNVLSEYLINQSNDNIRINVNNNALQIKALKTGNTKITLTKKYDYYDSKPLVYLATSSQNLFAVGNLDPVVTNLNINIQAGKVIINKIDSETNDFISQGDASLVGALYGLYDNNDNLITKLKINDIGTSESNEDLLINTTYYIKEINPSTGYKKDEEKHYFTISKDSLITNIELKEDIIKRKVDIFKVLGSNRTEILTPEENITFDIYLKSNNEYYTSISTNSSGRATVDLPYGVWIFKQKTSAKNYNKINDFEIIIDEENPEPITKIISNTLMGAKLRIIKKDSITNNIIPISGLKFKIKNVDTGKYINEYETNNGIIITEEIPAGNYQLEELIDQNLEDYELNKTPLLFSINEESQIQYDDEIGNYIELEFVNNPIVKVPDTYMNNNYILYGISITLLIAGLIYINKGLYE